jgi:hypothetical protein
MSKKFEKGQKRLKKVEKGRNMSKKGQKRWKKVEKGQKRSKRFKKLKKLYFKVGVLKIIH